MIPHKPEHFTAKALAAFFGSIILVHGVIIGGHAILDETTPRQTLGYALDRSLEWTEVQFMKLLSVESQVELHLHHAVERIDELEELVVESNDSTSVEAHLPDYMARDLLHDSVNTLRYAVDDLRGEVMNHTDSIPLFTLTLLMESTVDDMRQRLDVMASTIESDVLYNIMVNASTQLTTINSQLTDLENSFTIKEEDIRNVEQEVENLAEPVVPPRTQLPAEPACGVKNTSCETSSDCCTGRGLECTEVRVSDGSLAKRCLPGEQILVCNVECSDNNWSEPVRCQLQVPPNNVPRCERITGTTCRESVNADRNVRICTDS